MLQRQALLWTQGGGALQQQTRQESAGRCHFVSSTQHSTCAHATHHRGFG
jgi:hypothetical protein